MIIPLADTTSAKISAELQRHTSSTAASMSFPVKPREFPKRS